MRVGNALIRMYGKFGSIEVARLAFERITGRDAITWTVIISGLAQQGCGREALEIFRRMIAEGANPDEFSFVAVLLACSHTDLLNEAH